MIVRRHVGMILRWHDCTIARLHDCTQYDYIYIYIQVLTKEEVGLYRCSIPDDEIYIFSGYMQAVLVIDPFLHRIGSTACFSQKTDG